MPPDGSQYWVAPFVSDLDETVDVRIYHLERIANILNTPKMYGIRLEYLEIEMTKKSNWHTFHM